MRELDEKLRNALKSREERTILRRLPSGTRSFIDFCSNDYLSFASNPHLRAHFLDQLHNSECILGTGGSRLLVDSPAHAALEARLASFFGAPAALLFNSGFDANVGFFASVPQKGDILLYDEFIHASVHDGMRASRARGSTYAFKHNCLTSFKNVLKKVVEDRANVLGGDSSVFVAVESLYSMDGDFAPLRGILALLESILPGGNGHLIVDEAHATGLYGEQGRGIVSLLGLENRVTARLHTFGKALASSGAVILTNPLIREYLVNYARPLIYTTALTNASVININCSFDLLECEIGNRLSSHLARMCSYFLGSLAQHLRSTSSDLIHLPGTLQTSTEHEPCLFSPIIPLLTPAPRSLASHLQSLGFMTRPITHPTVPKGMDRVRVCIHAGNTMAEINGLLMGIVSWLVEDQKQMDSSIVLAKL